MLDKYLQTEQAREDVRVAVHAMATSKTSTFCGGLEDHWIESTHLEAWLRVAYFRFGGKDFLVSAYYRPDGDRYVVTDLGEGVRALRLRGASIQRLGDAISEVLGAMWVANQLPPSYGITGMVNGEIAPMSFIDAADLPDAICRVMLASLRVAQS